jgi:Tol biopolymer transport system component
VWSPDGSRIAFYSFLDTSSVEIYVMNADGSNLTRLTNNHAWDSDPQWSPDGKYITFTSARDGTFDIYVMNADGSKQTSLTHNPERTDFQPSWSP